MLSMSDLDLKNHVLLIQAHAGFQYATKSITSNYRKSFNIKIPPRGLCISLMTCLQLEQW
jgi:hypothetical protein